MPKQSRYFFVCLNKVAFKDVEDVKQLMSYMPYKKYQVRENTIKGLPSYCVDMETNTRRTPSGLMRIIRHTSWDSVGNFVIALTVRDFTENFCFTSRIYREDKELEEYFEQRKRTAEKLLEAYGVESINDDIEEYFQVNPLPKKPKSVYFPRVNKKEEVVEKEIERADHLAELSANSK